MSFFDLNLPKVEGHQLLARFRSHPLCRQTPVVVVPSSDAPRDREEAALLGAARYFRKPSDLDEFMQLGAVVRDAIAEAISSRASPVEPGPTFR